MENNTEILEITIEQLKNDHRFTNNIPERVIDLLANFSHQKAFDAIINHYPTHPKTLKLLHDRAQNDPDDQLRQWAQEQLQKLEINP